MLGRLNISTVISVLSSFPELFPDSQPVNATKTKKVNGILMELSVVEYLTNLRI